MGTALEQERAHQEALRAERDAEAAAVAETSRRQIAKSRVDKADRLIATYRPQVETLEARKREIAAKLKALGPEPTGAGALTWANEKRYLEAEREWIDQGASAAGGLARFAGDHPGPGLSALRETLAYWEAERDKYSAQL